MIVNNKNQEQLKKQQTVQQTPAAVQQPQQAAQPQQAQTQQQPIQVMQGVTAGTAEKLQQAQAGYQPTAEATAAQQALQALQLQKPQGYTSKYSGQLEDILQQLQGGQKFTYNVNDDAYFQSLKDTKTQLAKQAAMDTMGNAVALTGGYGNSAAQSVANQAYQNSLLSLYDDAQRGYELALQRYQMEQQGLGDQFNRMLQLEGLDYDRYRDTVGDYEREREYLTGRADTETERAREDWRYNLDYLTQLAQIENADYRNEQERQEAIRQFEQQYALQQEQLDWQKDIDQRNYDRDVLENDRNYEQQLAQFQWQKDVDQRNYDRDVLESDRAYELSQKQLEESIRQFNESLNWDKMSADQKYAAEYALMILQNGEMPSDEMLAAAGLSAEDAEKLKAQLATVGGGGGSGKAPTYYVDIAGNYYTQNKDGSYTQVDPKNVNPNGKEDLSKMTQLTATNAVTNAWSQAAGKQQAQKEQATAEQTDGTQRQQSDTEKAMLNTVKSTDWKKLLLGKKD